MMSQMARLTILCITESARVMPIANRAKRTVNNFSSWKNSFFHNFPMKYSISTENPCNVGLNLHTKVIVGEMFCNFK